MSKTMSGRLKLVILGFCGSLGFMVGAAGAETVLSVTQYSYDNLGRPDCTAVRMNEATWLSQADACALSSPASVVPDRITKTAYDAAGRVVQIKRALGVTTAKGFSEVDALEQTYATFSYSNNGKVIDTIDARGNRTRNVYDGFDRLTDVMYPSTTLPSDYNPSTQATALGTAGAHNVNDFEQYSYDENGNRKSFKRRSNYTINYTYDDLNRETFKDVPVSTGNEDAASKDIYTQYDLQGHILSKTFASATGNGVRYTYDALGRVTQAKDYYNTTLGYQYNSASQRTNLTFPDSKIQSYQYNAAGALTLTDMVGASVGLTPSYNSLGQVMQFGRSNNGNTSFTYDAMNRVETMSHDLTGTSNDVTWTFGYNYASQIASMASTNSTYDYYETQSRTEGPTFNGLNQNTNIAGLAGGYDFNGNVANEGSGGRILTYDIENRLLSVAGSVGGSSINLTLSYDPEGRLYQTNNNGTITTFLYDGVNLIGEFNGSGTWLRRYLHTGGTDQPWAVFEGSTATASNAKYLYANYQGSIIALANMNGDVSAGDRYSYGAYGEPKGGNSNEMWSGSRFRYTGQTIIPEARLYYYKARVYDPNIGRFLQTDPIGSEDDLNLYAYTGGDPINGTDPTGNEGCWGAVTLGACIGQAFSDAKQWVSDLGNPEATGRTVPIGVEYGSMPGAVVWVPESVGLRAQNAGLGAIGTTFVAGALGARGSGGSLKITATTYSESELKAAEYMSDLGNNVVLRSPVGTRAGGGTSDLLVNKVRYDVYTPTTGNANRIVSSIAKKNSQAEGVVLDLTNSSVRREDLGDVLARVRGAGATNIRDVKIIGN